MDVDQVVREVLQLLLSSLQQPLNAHPEALRNELARLHPAWAMFEAWRFLIWRLDGTAAFMSVLDTCIEPLEMAAWAVEQVRAKNPREQDLLQALRKGFAHVQARSRERCLPVPATLQDLYSMVHTWVGMLALTPPRVACIMAGVATAPMATLVAGAHRHAAEATVATQDLP